MESNKMRQAYHDTCMDKEERVNKIIAALYALDDETMEAAINEIISTIEKMRENRGAQ